MLNINPRVESERLGRLQRGAGGGGTGKEGRAGERGSRGRDGDAVRGSAKRRCHRQNERGMEAGTGNARGAAEPAHMTDEPETMAPCHVGRHVVCVWVGVPSRRVCLHLFCHLAVCVIATCSQVAFQCRN
jgi:hypothetical protein